MQLRRSTDYDRQINAKNEHLRRQLNNDTILYRARKAAAEGQSYTPPGAPAPDNRTPAEKRLDQLYQADLLRKALLKILDPTEAGQVMAGLRSSEIADMNQRWPQIQQYANRVQDITPAQLKEIYQDLKGEDVLTDLVKTRSVKQQRIDDVNRAVDQYRSNIFEIVNTIEPLIQTGGSAAIQYPGVRDDLVFLIVMSRLLQNVTSLSSSNTDRYTLDGLHRFTDSFPTQRHINSVINQHLDSDGTLRQGQKFKTLIKNLMQLVYMSRTQIEDFFNLMGTPPAEVTQAIADAPATLPATLQDISTLALPQQPTQQVIEDDDDETSGQMVPLQQQPDEQGHETPALTPNQQDQPGGQQLLMDDQQQNDEGEEESKFDPVELFGPRGVEPLKWFQLGNGFNVEFPERKADDVAKTIPGIFSSSAEFSRLIYAVREMALWMAGLMTSFGKSFPADAIREADEAAVSAANSSTKRKKLYDKLRKPFYQAMLSLQPDAEEQARRLFNALGPSQFKSIPMAQRMSYVYYLATKDMTPKPEQADIFAQLSSNWKSLTEKYPTLFPAVQPITGAGLYLTTGRGGLQLMKKGRQAAHGRIFRGRGVPCSNILVDPFTSESLGVVVENEGSTNMAPFGRHFINKKKLLKDHRFHLVTGNGTPVKGYSNIDLNGSDDVHGIIVSILRGLKTIDEEILNRLQNDDKKWLSKLMEKAGLDSIFDIPYEDTEMERFDLLKGHIMAGGTNRDELREFRQLLMGFVKEGRLSQSIALDICQELLDL